MKIKNSIFSLLVCLLLVGPAILLCTQSVAKIPLPKWLTSESAEYLAGGTANATTGIREKLEAKISGNIPLKASALLGNAAIERCFIEASNSLFDWECYPTFFGSKIVYSSRHNAVCRMPNKYTKEEMDGIDNFAMQLSDFAQDHKNTTFFLIVADGAEGSEINPAAPMTSKNVHNKDYVELIRERCKIADNVVVSMKAYSSFEKYLSDFYSTDHHWNGYGTIAAFNELAHQTELSEYVINSGSAISFSPFVMNGSCSRDGLMLLDENVNEPSMEVSNLSIEPEEVSIDILRDDGKRLLLEAGLRSEYAFYSTWYGSFDFNLIVSDKENYENALIVGDSMGCSMRWVIASKYSRTYFFTDLYYSSKEDITLNDRLASSCANTVFFVGLPDDYATFTTRHPRYFS